MVMFTLFEKKTRKTMGATGTRTHDLQHVKAMRYPVALLRPAADDDIGVYYKNFDPLVFQHRTSTLQCKYFSLATQPQM